MDDIRRLDIVDIDLNSGNVFRNWKKHTIGTADSQADRFGVRVFRNGEAVNLEQGTVQGYFHNSQGENIAITGSDYCSISGNRAIITLPQACYNYEGQFTLAIKLINLSDETTETMRIVDGMVDNTNTGSAVAPTGTVPTYSEILAMYSEMLEATEDVTEFMENVVAPEYAARRYLKGDYCLHNGKLYRCITEITEPEAWNSSHWEQVDVTGDFSNALKTKPDIKKDSYTAADLDITDEDGNVLARFENGEFRTEIFDSMTTPALKQSSGSADAVVADSAGNVLMSLEKGHIKTEKFDSEEVNLFTTATLKNASGSSDIVLADMYGNVLLRLRNGHLKVKEFNTEETVAMKNTSGSADMVITDSFGNVILRLKDGHLKTEKFDSEEINGEITEAIETEIAGINNELEIIDQRTTGIMYRNHDAIDGIYAACSWAQEHNPNYPKQLCLLIAADIHDDIPRFGSLIELFNAVDAFDAGILLGDIVYSNWQNSAAWYTEALANANKPFLTGIGNHDVGDGRTVGSVCPSTTDLYNKFIAPNIQYADLSQSEYTSGNTFYYKDFAAYGIRLIVVNQYEYPSDVGDNGYVYYRGSNCYSQSQITWLCNTLLNTPANYGVLMAMHSFPAEMEIDRENTLCASTVTNTTPSDIMAHSTDGWMIPQIVDAWINGTSLTKTFGYTPEGSWTGVSVDADFSGRGAGEFIAYIGGHWHMSVTAHVKAYPAQKMYSVDVASMPASRQGDTPRRAGTKSEDCFCALAVDRTNKTVKIFRVGAHYTFDGTDRQYGLIDY